MLLLVHPAFGSGLGVDEQFFGHGSVFCFLVRIPVIDTCDNRVSVWIRNGPNARSVG